MRLRINLDTLVVLMHLLRLFKEHVVLLLLLVGHIDLGKA